jgi:hypothetical protein
MYPVRVRTNPASLILSAVVGLLTGCGDGGGSESSCQPGTQFCSCLQGACQAGLACENGFCLAPGGETGGDGDGDSGDGDGDSGDGDGDSGDGDGEPGDGDSGDGDGDSEGDGDGDPNALPTDCADLLAANPGAPTGVYMIDLDGAGPLPKTEALCEMSIGGGGWTLVFTASDDDVDTWTWNNRASLSEGPFTVGDANEADFDFMSPAYHNLALSDLLFIHQPSAITAIYADVGNGDSTLGEIIQAEGSPVCDFNLGGNGYPLTGGTLTTSGMLCDTDLYFNLGDHEMDLNSCMDFGSGSNSATYGPVWNATKGAGCPFDDPAEFGLGPHGPCGACPAGFPSTEFSYLGYGNALALNDGAIGSGANHMQIYVR